MENSVWQLLPVELALHVFTWLPPAELVRAGAVCKQWHGVIGPTSAHASYLWRTVHDAWFGGAWMRPSRRQAALTKRRQRESGVAAPPRPPRPDAVDWRASCLRCEWARDRLWSAGDVTAMLRWTITQGHHVLLRRLLATADPAAIARFEESQHAAAGRDNVPSESTPGHASRWAQRSDQTVDIVTARMGVSIAAIRQAVKLRCSPTAFDTLVQRFVAGRQDAAPWSTEQLGDALAKLSAGRTSTPVSAAQLFLRAGKTGNANAMQLLLSRCSTAAMRDQLLSATDRLGNTGEPEPLIHNHSSDDIQLTLQIGLISIALLAACARGQTKVFELLLPKLSDQQVRETTGHDRMSALILSIRRGNVVMARALLDRGALTRSNPQEHTVPLCAAVTAGANRMELVDLLLEHGADINAQSTEGRTCLRAACRSRQLNHRLIGHLLAKGANAQGLGVLQALLQRPPPLPSSSGSEQACRAFNAERTAVATMLLERGAPIVDDQRASPVALVLRWVGLACSGLAQTEDAAVRMLDLLSAHGHTIHGERVEVLTDLVGHSSPRIIRHLATTQDLGAALGEAGARAAVLLAPCYTPATKARLTDNMLALCAALDNIRLEPGVTRAPGYTPPVHLLSLWHGEPCLPILTALVRHGADINARDDQGRTFVHRYLERAAVPDITTLQAWRSLGFDFSLCDARGRTPADVWNARPLGHWAIMHRDRLRALQVECEEEHLDAMARSLH